jgi:hypothetical protein
MTPAEIDNAIASGKLTYVRGGRMALIRHVVKTSGGS